MDEVEDFIRRCSHSESCRYLGLCTCGYQYALHAHVKLKEENAMLRKGLVLANKIIGESMHDSYYSTCYEYNQEIAEITKILTEIVGTVKE